MNDNVTNVFRKYMRIAPTSFKSDEMMSNIVLSAIGMAKVQLQFIDGPMNRTEIDFKEKYGVLMRYFVLFLKEIRADVGSLKDPALYPVRIQESIGYILNVVEDGVMLPASEVSEFSFHVHNIINIVAANSKIKGFSLDDVLKADLKRIQEENGEALPGYI